MPGPQHTCPAPPPPPVSEEGKKNRGSRAGGGKRVENVSGKQLGRHRCSPPGPTCEALAPASSNCVIHYTTIFLDIPPPKCFFPKEARQSSFQNRQKGHTLIVFPALSSSQQIRCIADQSLLPAWSQCGEPGGCCGPQGAAPAGMVLPMAPLGTLHTLWPEQVASTYCSSQALLWRGPVPPRAAQPSPR